MRIQDKFFFKAHRSLNAHSPYKNKQPILRMHTAVLPNPDECNGSSNNYSSAHYDITPVDSPIPSITYLGYKKQEEFVDKIKRIRAIAAKFMEQNSF